MTELEYSWECMNCDEKGEGEKFDSEANSHTKNAGHATLAYARPKRK